MPDTLGKRTSSVLWLAVSATAAALAVALWLGWRQASVNEHSAAVQREEATLRSRVAVLEVRFRTSREKLAAVEADNGRLLREIESGDVTAIARAQRPRLNRETIQARYQEAQASERAGNIGAALEGYLWCYDIGFLRDRGVMDRIWALGEKHFDGREALRQRRDRAYALLLANPEEIDALGDMVQLNRVLGEPERNMAFYDKLAPADPRRQLAGSRVVPDLLEARRYLDLVRVLPPYARALANLSAPKASPEALAVQEAALARLAANPAEAELQRGARERARAAQRRVVLEPVGLLLEALAGVGDLERARVLAEKMLIFEPTSETRLLMQRHLERAGQPGLLGSLPEAGK